MARPRAASRSLCTARTPTATRYVSLLTQCHTRLHRPKCQACHGAIDDEVVHALRADWHPACFVCTRCHAPLHDAEVYRGPDGAPCDRACYEAWLRRAS